jgi:SNF2 family DNA or RNA helicase
VARAQLELGGKYGRDILFRGNKKYLPARIRGIISNYFNQWNSLRDIAQYPQLVADLGNAGAERHFLGTDWEKLNGVYQERMQRMSLVFRGGIDAGELWFSVTGSQDSVSQPLAKVLSEHVDQQGRLRDNFDIWRLEKLLRRGKAQIEFDPSFGAALSQFGKQAISLEESLSFFRQIQAYHSPDFLAPKLRAILEPAIDEVHTLRRPTELATLAQGLKDAGARLRIDPAVETVVEHYTKLEQVAAELDGIGTQKAAAGAGAISPGALRAELYPFQRTGVAFLTVNGRALLADDMGLGKTLQAIAAALYLKQQQRLKRALIVCPASLKYQWQAEIQRFTGERCEVIGGDKQERERIYNAAAVTGGFVALEDMPLFYIINYELVYRDINRLKELGADLLILDEAQRVKNFRTKTNKAVLELKTPFMFVLTGTPLENQLMELYTIMRFIDDRALGKNPLAFRDRYVVLDAFGGIKGYRLVEEVARKIASLTLRRTREQTLTELPPRVENNVWVELSEVQHKIYRELQGQAREVLSDSAWDTVKANNAMTLLQRLREVCDTPELLDPEHTDSPKLNELLALIEDEVGALDRQVLVFTQWTRVGEILVRELRKAGFSPGFLHGGLKPPQRATLVERFQAGEDRVFISTDAGGTGLNLQAASLVVNFDLPFNPAKLNQRIARAHRLGQEMTVFVANLLCRGTVEAKMLKILQEKQDLFDDVFGDISDPTQPRSKPPQQRTLRELLRELVH